MINYFDIINYYVIGFIILKKKIIFLLSFFIISSIFIYAIYSLIENRKKEHLNAEKKIIEVTYNTIIDAYKVILILFILIN